MPPSASTVCVAAASTAAASVRSSLSPEIVRPAGRRLGAVAVPDADRRAFRCEALDDRPADPRCAAGDYGLPSLEALRSIRFLSATRARLRCLDADGRPSSRPGREEHSCRGVRLLVAVLLGAVVRAGPAASAPSVRPEAASRRMPQAMASCSAVRPFVCDRSAPSICVRNV